MEYCSRHGLLDFMNQNLRDLLSETQVLQISSDIGAGIAYMHYQDSPLIHRDLKVENVLISDDGIFKLCDFGSASPVLRPPRNAQEFQILHHDIQNHTTMQYRSPEMVDLTRAFPIDEKSDIWAFGVFIYKLCYFTTPFEKIGDSAILSAKFSFPLAPQFSQRLKRLISSCLSKDPRNRPNIYQVLKEIYDMRGVKLPLSNIYTSPTSTQRAAKSVSSSAPYSSPSKLPASLSTSGGLLDPITSSKSMVNVSTTASKSNLKPPLEISQTNSQIDLIKYANTRDPKPTHTLTNTSKVFSNDSFATKSPSKPLLNENELEHKTYQDITSKFPTIEELSLGLNKQPLQPSRSRLKTPATHSTLSSHTDKSENKYQHKDKSIPFQQPPPTVPTTSSWIGLSSKSTVSAKPNNEYLSSPQGTSSVDHAAYSPQTQLRPQMVSRSTMTSPVVSRSHTPVQPKNFKSSATSSPNYPTKYSANDVGVGTNDYSLLNENRPSLEIKLDQNAQKLQKVSRSNEKELKYDTNNGKQSSLDKAQLPYVNIQLPEIALIEPIETGEKEKDKLKKLLTGINELSTTIVFDDENTNNSVDFLKSLDRESTGRSRHKKTHSGSSIREDLGVLVPTPAVSNKKSNGLLKHFSPKNSDPFKGLDNKSSFGFSRKNSSQVESKERETKRSSCINILNSSDSGYENNNDYTYDLDRSPPTPKPSNSEPVRKTSNGIRPKSSVQSRIQALMNSQNESPPPKTASGYGKYTDLNQEQKSGDSVSSQNQYWSSNIKPSRLSAEFSHDEGNTSGERKSFELVLRNREKVRDMATQSVTVALSDDSHSKDTFTSPKSHSKPKTSQQHVSKQKDFDKEVRSDQYSQESNNISSTSPSAEAARSTRGNSRKPPKPFKPAHLMAFCKGNATNHGKKLSHSSSKSTTKAKTSAFDKPKTGNSDDPGKKPVSDYLRTKYSKHVSMTQTPDLNTSNRSSFDGLSPVSSPEILNDEDWEKTFESKYPSVY